ncbi:MAG TPA: beta-ketoacyl-ACP synthase II [Thermoanaerobaculia bacterium]|nr:beta-ketoacyl-ACP synthase II [Thermoanaerobaculia bacterium]
MSRSDRRRVVVTGVGLVSPLGIGTSETWQALLAGRSGIGRITRFDLTDFGTTIAGEVKDFDPTRWVEKKEVKKMDLFIHYALAASQMALEDSGFAVTDENAERVGVVIGSGIGGFPMLERMHSTLVEKGPNRLSPFFIPGVIANLAAGQVSIRHGARGPSSAPCTACTTGLHAVGDAYRLIQHGYADAALAGGTEGAITPLAVGGFSVMGALSTRNDEPERASRPWDKDRDGFVMGEGAGILLIEELEQAKRRGASIYCEIVGYGMSSDAYHMAAPHPEGLGAAAVMRAALADAELPLDSVSYINAHGTSTPLGDIAEVRAVRSVFGPHADELAMSSTKSSTGHLLGAAGGLECGLLALAVKHQVYPATLNLDEPGEGCDLDFVPNTPREAPMEIALTNSFGFGGTNGALLMRRFG